MFDVIITGPAKQDIQSAYEWWAEHRDPEQAARWYTGIYRHINSLGQMPERHSLATEPKLSQLKVRQSLYGLGRKPTHRVVFVIDNKEVIVLRVRHTSQDALGADDI